MRKFLLILLLALPLIAFGKVADPSQICGTVHFSDGHEETFRYVKLPSSRSAALTVGKDGPNNLISIPAEKVMYITVWHVDFPDKTYSIYALDYKPVFKKSNRITNFWGRPMMASEWGLVFRVSSYYEIHDDGEFFTVTIIKNGWGSDFMLLKCRDFEHAQWLGLVDGKNGAENGDNLAMVWQTNPKNIAQVFASNPRISQQIADGKLQANDLRYILDQMSLMSEEDKNQLEEEPSSGLATNRMMLSKQARLEYTNYISSTYQSLFLAWEYNVRYFFAGAQVGFYEDQYQLSHRVGAYEYTYDTIARPTLALGLRIGWQVPIHMGQKYLAVPRFMAAPSILPITLTTGKDKGPAVYASLPLSLGTDFSFPLKNGKALHAGIHYVYEFSFNGYAWETVETANRKIINDPFTNIDQATAVGQSGVQVSLSYRW